jgi:restriction endonuclease S subunit
MSKALTQALSSIPAHWKSVKFRNICKVRQGLQIQISARFKEPGPGRYPYITIQHLNEKSKSPEFIQDPSPSVICHEYDILMTRTGNTGIVVTDVYGVFHNNFFLIDYNRGLVDKEFLLSYLRSELVQHEILIRAGTTTIPDLNHGDFYSIDFPLPPLPEQRKIAVILSTWDEAIALTGRRIEAARQRKKGLMQRLPTGRVRFPEFVRASKRRDTKYGDLPVDWKYVPIGKVAREVSVKNEQDHDYPVLSCTKHYGLVNSLEYFGRQIYSDDLSTYKIVKRNHLPMPQIISRKDLSATKTYTILHSSAQCTPSLKQVAESMTAFCTKY